MTHRERAPVGPTKSSAGGARRAGKALGRRDAWRAGVETRTPHHPWEPRHHQIGRCHSEVKGMKGADRPKVSKVAKLWGRRLWPTQREVIANHDRREATTTRGATQAVGESIVLDVGTRGSTRGVNQQGTIRVGRLARGRPQLDGPWVRRTCGYPRMERNITNIKTYGVSACRAWQT